MKHLLTLLMPAALCAASPAPAQFPDVPATGGHMLGGDVADLCQTASGTPSMMCATFLRGTYEGLMFGQISAAGDMVSFCPPEGGLSVTDLRQTFLDFVDDDDARRSEEAGMVLLDSLQDRYPCDNADASGKDPDSPDAGVAVDQAAFRHHRRASGAHQHAKANLGRLGA